MLEYPSILSWRMMPDAIDEPCYAFTKYDGSNLRWEWSPKQGWYKRGTRHQLFDARTPIYGEAVKIFEEELGEMVVTRIHESYGKKVERIVAFTEFFGRNSFAGNHLEDDQKMLKLFDVSVYKKGFMSPKDFYNVFGKEGSRYDKTTGVANLEYRGPLTQEFIDEVRNDQLPVTEGVVCKGGEGHHLWRTKIKTLSYLTRLREEYPRLYEEDGDLI